ncbi:MAG TPA: AAA family ATPase [Opitutales bacterium]|nr:AAA family ATPase [Opitutales bacterium]
MSDKDDKNPFEEMQKQMQEMFKNTDISSVFGQMGATPSGADAKPEDPEEDEKTSEILRRIEHFNLKPREIRDYLDRFVIRQNEAKKVLSVAICDHYNHVRRCIENPRIAEKDYAKQNIILLGPTGVGKTYLMRCISKLIGVPFVKADATKFSETGYVGHDAEDLVRDLVKAANGNVDLAQYGIIYIDEIDKIASAVSTNGGGRDVSGRGVQINFLKLMEETDVNLFSQTDILGQMQAMMSMQRGGKQTKKTINTRHILFIVSGAFARMGELVKRRVESTQIGFSTAPTDIQDETDYLKLARTPDFIQYGFEPEFIGRLPVRVACESLNSSDLEKILLQSEGSILSQYKSDFKGYGIELEITPDAIKEIASRAEAEKTGARSLMTILERGLRDFKFELPSTSIKSLKIDRAAILDPQTALKNLLRENQSEQRAVLAAEVEKFAERFRKEYNIKLQFTPEAVEKLVEISLAEGKTIRSLCETRFHDFHHGLKLISGNTGRTEFTITPEVVENPDRELSQWVVETYQKEET